MNLHYDEKTGKANKVVERHLANNYRKAIEKIVDYLSLELFKYNRTIREVPNDVFDKAHQFIDNVRYDFIDNTLEYYFEQAYINVTDCRKILISFYETIAQLEDIYLYKTMYKKSSFHHDYEKYEGMINEIDNKQVWRTPVLFLF